MNGSDTWHSFVLDTKTETSHRNWEEHDACMTTRE